MTFSIKIADVVLTAVSPNAAIHLTLNTPYIPFQSTEHNTDISFHYQCSPLPSCQEGRLIFDSQGSYRIYRHQEKYLIPLGKGETTRLAAFDKGFTHGEVYNAPPKAGECREPLTIYLFEHPLDQIALVNYLAPGRGVLMHAGALVAEGRGWLFPGVSGAGKSTMINLWQGAGVNLLGDDRIIIRRRHGSFRIYGTPWHGEARIASPDSGTLDKIFFLEKAPQNFIRPLTPMEAVTRLVVCSFPPLYDKDGMGAILDFFSQLVAQTPCYELGFVPEAGVRDFIRGVA